MSRKGAVVIATQNEHKLREIRLIWGRLPFSVIGLNEICPRHNVRETGSTLEANALLKARAALKKTRMVSVADDTGLEVKVLGGGAGCVFCAVCGARV